MAWDAAIPRVVRLDRRFDVPVIREPEKTAFASTLSQLGAGRVKRGARIAIAIGSRGIWRISEIIAAVVRAVKEAGGSPFIVPAMGSHGGNDPVKKAEILRSLGITEESAGAPVSRNTEAVEVGRIAGGWPVFCHKEAAEAAGIVVVNRVKPHTDFQSDFGSGLMKMMVVGLGGQKTAGSIHSQGYDSMAALISDAAELMLSKLPVLAGLAIIEGPTHETFLVEAMPGPRIPSRDRELYQVSKALVPTLPVKRLDVLVICRVGKDISGIGMDPIVTGRYSFLTPSKEENAPWVDRIAVLDLTAESEGNASGIGLADVTTFRLVRKMDRVATYTNVITSRGSATARIPMIMESDREAISTALLTCHKPVDRARFVMIEDTLHLETIWVSENLAGEAGVSDETEAREIQFDECGSLSWPYSLGPGEALPWLSG